ncbi:MAG: hypothetical protein WBF74_13635, partial [Parvibaculum sp.]
MSDGPRRSGKDSGTGNGGRDREANRLGRRLQRYAKVAAGVGGLAARAAGAQLFGGDQADARLARELKVALGGLKGP